MRRAYAWVTEVGKALMRGWAESLRGLWGKELAILGFTTAKTVMRFRKFFIGVAAFFVAVFVILSCIYGLAEATMMSSALSSILHNPFMGMGILQSYVYGYLPYAFFEPRRGIPLLLEIGAIVVPVLCIVFTAIAVARPSLARKNSRYYLSCFRRGFAPFLISWLILPQLFVSEALLWFFFLDAPEKGWRLLVYAFGRTVAFHLLFLPAIVLVNLSSLVLSRFSHSFVLMLQRLGLPPLFFVGFYTVLAFGLLIFFFSLLSSLYIKYKHRYHDLFFGKA